ncbi:protein of unknown function [Serratia sp. Tan611]|nr:protein of unknown function [Serratia sp. Tan611]
MSYGTRRQAKPWSNEVNLIPLKKKFQIKRFGNFIFSVADRNFLGNATPRCATDGKAPCPARRHENP